MKIRTTVTALTVFGLLAGSASAQRPVPNPTQPQPSAVDRDPQHDRPLYRVTVIGRTTHAVNYRHRGGATKIDFRGTPVLPKANGEAKVESKQGYIEIEVEFDELKPATTFGREYLTYVLWAITPQGRATNLGELLLNGNRGKLNVTTELQSFGLVVTAEPYFAVTQPSDVVVLENVVRADTRGAIETVDAEYELLARGSYVMTSDPRDLPVQKVDRDTPLELYEARNAVYFARVAGANEYAVPTYQKAAALLAKAEQDHEKDRGRRAVIGVAREAAQAAEDSRLIALQRREAEMVARERRITLERETAARTAEAAAVQRAEQERQQRASAEAERQAAIDQQRATERAAAELAERATRERAALERERQESDRLRAQSDAARLAAENARAEAERAMQQLARERADADARAQQLAQQQAETSARADQLARERAEAEARAQRADAAASAAQQTAAQAERERAALREKLQQQLNIILETRESARGLIVNMSDVLFDTASANLKPGAREKLARVAGVLLAYPGLAVEVEGHTDSVGTDDYNQQLSERRAAAVRTYLVSQGIPQDTIAAMGFGEGRPVVTNDTAAGRQQNRRVELVISGDAIATAERRH